MYILYPKNDELFSQSLDEHRLVIFSSYVVVYTMDHEAVPRLCKICSWLLNASRDHVGLHQGKEKKKRKNVRVTMKLEVSHYPPTWSNGYCGGRGKRSALVEKARDPWHRKVVIIMFEWFFIFYWGRGEGGGREVEDKRTQENSQPRYTFLFPSKTAFFEHSYSKNNQHVHFLGGWSILLVQV